MLRSLVGSEMCIRDSPDHQGKGVGTLLHRGRLQCLHSLAPDTPGVVLSARGSSLEEALSILAPRLNADDDDPSDLTPQFSKTEIFEFTFRTSLGVVHLAHGKDEQGWKFVGVDESDGGPVWCTNDTLANIVKASKAAAYKKKGFPPPLVPVSYTHLRAHETPEHLVCRLLLEKKKKKISNRTCYGGVVDELSNRIRVIYIGNCRNS
eukprot:TRINITY_DN29745_c0_g1_i2.p1 TRINITY_DN29745_c0_g1~~TRINITY_DN29745_c0_g1_i2.p1  ORF type:complete len:207 (-),score=37.20 TRINITY_DN29745_c0_g1_i2:20-640(-)